MRVFFVRTSSIKGAHVEVATELSHDNSSTSSSGLSTMGTKSKEFSLETCTSVMIFMPSRSSGLIAAGALEECGEWSVVGKGVSFAKDGGGSDL
jgi:hypothetical protein